MEIAIGLGANLGNPAAAFLRALECLTQLASVMAVSSLYRSRAVGPPQPDYLNAAALVDWPGTPRSLLTACLRLEAEVGRDRSKEQRWGPRVLDLDLLLGKRLVCRGPDLELPHPRLLERSFALVPAAELAPSWRHPIAGRTLAACVEACAELNGNDAGLRVVAAAGDW